VAGADRADCSLNYFGIPQITRKGDLTDFAQGVVGKSGNIDIFLRLAS
jgi:hypothetical protein